MTTTTTTAAGMDRATDESEQNQQQQQQDRILTTIFDIPIYFHDDWNVGIGGGLWSTGMALSQYFGTDHAVQGLRNMLLRKNTDSRGLRIVELGSGNGVLAVCLAACATAHNIPIDTLVVTDFADHVPLMQATIDANPAALGTTRTIRVAEYVWGSDTLDDTRPFDIVIGSDVAYGPDCYNDLLQSLRTLLATSSPGNNNNRSSIALIGFTLMDTRPYFFDRLVYEYGLRYRKLSDHLLESAFRGTTFGVFVIQRKE